MMSVPAGDVFSIQSEAEHSRFPVEIRSGHPWLRTPPGPSPRYHSRRERAHEPQRFVSREPFHALAADLMRGPRCHCLGCDEVSLKRCPSSDERRSADVRVSQPLRLVPQGTSLQLFVPARIGGPVRLLKRKKQAEKKSGDRGARPNFYRCSAERPTLLRYAWVAFSAVCARNAARVARLFPGPEAHFAHDPRLLLLKW